MTPAQQQEKQTYNHRFRAMIPKIYPVANDESLAELARFVEEMAPRARDPEERDQDLLQTYVEAAGSRTQFDPSMANDAKLRVLDEVKHTAARCDNPWLLPWINLRIVEVYVDASQLEQAVDAAESALTDVSTPTHFELFTRSTLAVSLRGLGKWQRALEELDKLRPRLEEFRDQAPKAFEADLKRIETSVLVTRARIDLELGSPDRADESVKEALELAWEIRDPEAIAKALLCAADLALLTERFERVEQKTQEALDDRAIRFLPSHRAKFMLFRGLARSALARERDDSSLARLAEEDLCAAIGDRSLPQTDRNRARGFYIDLLLREGRKEDAREAAEELSAPLEGLRPDMRDMAQRARVALDCDMEHAELAAILEELEASFGEFLDSVARIPPQAGGVGFMHVSYHRQVVSTLIRLALKVDGLERGTERAFGFLLRAQGAGTLARKLKTKPVELADVRRYYLGDGHGALVYVPSRDVTHVFAVDDEVVLHKEIPHSATFIRDRVSLLHEALWSRPADRGSLEAERQTAKIRLYAVDAALALLPDEVLDRLRAWPQVTVVGTEMMLDVPFDCLVLDGDRMLGIEHAVTTLPSLPMGVALAQAAALRGVVPREGLSLGLFATLSPKELPDGAEARDFTQDDARQLTDAFSSNRVRTHIGAGFTRDALLQAKLKGTSVLQLISHGDYDPELERGAGLLVADGAIRCEDIDGLDGFTGLAVPMACETATGPLRQGDDTPPHLGGAFLWAGAQVVVLSPGKLHFGTAMELMAKFYDHLLAGASPAESLRRARVDLEDPHATFHRAQMRVMGLGHAPLVKE